MDNDKISKVLEGSWNGSVEEFCMSPDHFAVIFSTHLGNGICFTQKNDNSEEISLNALACDGVFRVSSSLDNGDWKNCSPKELSESMDEHEQKFDYSKPISIRRMTDAERKIQYNLAKIETNKQSNEINAMKTSGSNAMKQEKQNNNQMLAGLTMKARQNTK